MSRKLSIITPCYNCSKTLEESLASVYTQGLEDFEVILVDDGSTDGTRELIKQLAVKYPNVSFYFHEKNLGGGAARNTGIKAATGDLIFCLDGDDVVPEGMLKKMVDFLEEKKVDGVLFHESRFFKGTNIHKTHSSKNEILDRTVTLDDLFKKKGALTTINFLYTKASYNKTLGYPENHGLDTQGFGHRYLAAGNSVMVCPDTFYFHRQAAGSKSYFERVYESGDFSKNMYLIYEEILFLFSPKVCMTILESDVFKNSSLGNENIAAKVDALFTADEKGFFVDNFQNYLRENGDTKYYEEHRNSSEMSDLFFISTYDYRKGNYDTSIDIQKKLLKKNPENLILYYNILRNAVAIAHPDEKMKVESITSELLESLRKRTQATDMRLNILGKIIRKMKRTLGL